MEKKLPKDLSDPLKVDAALKEQRLKYVNNGYASLPEGLRRYIEVHEKFIGCPVIGISIGPGRDETVMRSEE